MVNINYRAREQILTRRKELVELHKDLLKRPYNPSSAIFGQIVTGKPWSGIIGCTVYGDGEKAILGDSEETRFLFNPYLLVGASSWTNEIWKADKLSSRELDSSDFPFCWQPSIIRFYPTTKVIQAAYEVSTYNKGLLKYKDYLKDPIPTTTFNLVAYNARDFGYNYIYVDLDKSKNLINAQEVKSPTQIVQYIHCGGSCGYQGGCNNMSPMQNEIQELSIKELPARAYVKLWKSHPGSVSRNPDLVVALEFR